jgi:hypothetical protein
LFDGRLALVGAALPQVALPGEAVDVRLHWRRAAPLPAYSLHLIPRCGGRGASGALAWGPLPPSEWPREGVVVTRHTLELPPAGQACEIELGLGQEGVPVGWRPVWQPLEREWYALGTVQVGRQGVPSFGDRLALVEAQVDSPAARPGGQVQVSLTWQSLRPLSKDYTVFVQALGPDGRLYGQDDSWPVAGTFPTSQWRPGERVEDVHRFSLRPDAPPGRYRVIAGWYLLATMERLPVQDEQGRDAADFVEVGVLDVRE